MDVASRHSAPPPVAALWRFAPMHIGSLRIDRRYRHRGIEGLERQSLMRVPRDSLFADADNRDKLPL